jgi:hypothetical protein
MTFFIIIAALTAFVVVYVVWLRKWLKTKPWSQGFFTWIEPFEIALFKKSETIFWARFKMFIGVLLTTLTQTQTINITPLLPLVPDAWEPVITVAFNLLPLTITVVGMIDEKLRNETTTPLAIVALAEKDMTPAIIEAVAVADAAKVEAVAVVKVAEVEKAAAVVADAAKTDAAKE